jgi:hypothetical protein
MFEHDWPIPFPYINKCLQALSAVEREDSAPLG